MAKNTGTTVAAATTVGTPARIGGKSASRVQSSAQTGARHLSEKVFEELEIVHDPTNLFHQTIEQVLIAADLVGLKHHQQIIIAQPKNEIMVHFPVLMDDGHHRLFKGYRVQIGRASCRERVESGE